MAAVRIFVLLAISFLAANGQGVNNYWAEKPGACPPPLSVDICTNSCYVDGQCQSNGKCCPTSCGGTVCSRPVSIYRPIEHPGSCSAKPSGRWVCSSTCRSDGDCIKGPATKCCKNRCGAFVCQRPAIEVIESLEILYNSQPERNDEDLPNSGNPFAIFNNN